MKILMEGMIMDWMAKLRRMAQSQVTKMVSDCISSDLIFVFQPAERTNEPFLMSHLKFLSRAQLEHGCGKKKVAVDYLCHLQPLNPSSIQNMGHARYTTYIQHVMHRRSPDG